MQRMITLAPVHICATDVPTQPLPTRRARLSPRSRSRLPMMTDNPSDAQSSALELAMSPVPTMPITRGLSALVTGVAAAIEPAGVSDGPLTMLRTWFLAVTKSPKLLKAPHA